MFGPTTGDRVRLADTELVIEIESDRTVYGEEVKFGGGKVIRDGMGQSQRDARRGRGRHRHHQRRHPRPLGHRQGRYRHPRRPHRGIGKAGNPDIQPGVDIVIGPGTEVIAGEGRIVTAGGIDAHIHFICPQQVEEALYSGVTTMLGGGTGPAAGTAATTCTPGPWHLARMLQAAEGIPVNLGFFGKGNAIGAAARWSRWSRPAPAASSCTRIGARRRRRSTPASAVAEQLRRRGGDPHRHAQRIRLRRGHDRRLQGPHHPRLSHRRRRRRPCARHHQVVRPAERAAVLDQSDAALHGQHHRRASRHADGVPSPRPAHPRGCRLRREPHPPRDDRRRGHPARSRRLQHDVVGQPGDGPGRRGDHPHLADRRQDEAPARPAARGQRRATTISGSSAMSPNTRSTRH